MKNLAQLGGQLLGIWKQLGLNQRISIVLAGGVVVLGLFGIAFWSGQPNFGLLYGKLDDSEAAKVVGVLEELKVPHKVGQGGSAIYVPLDKVHTMRMQLASRGIPRGDGVGFEIFDKPNFGISDFVQRANYLRAIQGELARTIAQLDEVEAARVMVVAPENRLLVDNQKKPTASVFIRTRGGAPMGASAVNAIRFLVANAVEGLQASQVTVVDNRGNVLSENTDTDSVAGLTASQLSARRNLEHYLGKKAEGMLETVLGPGQAVVRVSAEINVDSLTRVEEKFDPEGQVVRTSTVNDESTDTTSLTGSGGAPGLESNLGGDTNTVASPSNNSRVKKKVTESEYEINKTVSNLTQLAGGIKRLSAAVFVAARYEGTGTERKLTPRPPEELEKLRRIVQSAVGIQPPTPGSTTSRSDEITLEEMPFNDSLSEVAQDTTRQQTRQFWWDQAHKLVYVGIVLAVFAVFWRLLKRTPAGSLTELSATGANGSANAQAEWRAPQRGGIVSVEVLNKLVRENPNNFSDAIQNWLTREGPAKK
jgi:flagellar M-ring protein FliF